IGHEKVLTKIRIDEEAEQLLQKQGYSLDEVPPKDAFVKLAATGNMSTGGTSIDRTWKAHQDHVEIAEEAARSGGLDVAGVDFAAFEVARGGILREGLGYGRNDVAVVTNVTGDHLGLKGIESIRQLAAVKRVIVEAVPRSGHAVLNADDELVAEMRKHCSGS